MEIHKMYRTDARETSIEAAKPIFRILNELQAKVLYFAEQKPEGFTDEEMNFFFDTHRSTFRARRSELVNAGLIMDSGRKAKMVNGRNATVWILSEYMVNSNE
jgi:hypothetical protein